MNAMMSIDFLLTDKSGEFHVNTNRRHTDSHGITMMKLTHHAGFASTHLPQHTNESWHRSYNAPRGLIQP